MKKSRRSGWGSLGQALVPKSPVGAWEGLCLWSVYPFPVTVVTSTANLKQQNLVSDGSEPEKSDPQASGGLCPLQAPGESPGCSSSLRGRLVVLGWWPHPSSPRLHLHVASLLSASPFLCVSHQDICHWIGSLLHKPG